MPTKSPRQKRKAADETDALRHERAESSSLPKGGMSPLADRKDAADWAESIDARPATDAPARRGPHAGRATPGEPVGGWVDGSTGRGKILVPAKDAKKPASGREDDRDAYVSSGPERDAAGRSSAAPPGTSSGPRARRRRKRKDAAEAAAEERQEEDRNHQGALQDMAEAEADEEADENP